MSDETATTKGPRHRSRNFPIYSLQEAIDKVQLLKQAEGASWTPTDIAIKHWGLSLKGSTGLRTLGALDQFGLLEDEGTGKNRRIRPSVLAGRILGHPGKEERRKALQEAALNPPLYQEIWSRHKGQLPSDDNLRWDLTGKGEPHKGDLNEKAVGRFISSFRATLEFAGLIESGILKEEGDDILPSAIPVLEGKKPMLTANVPGQTNFDLPIYLSHGQATLRMPTPMTAEDFEKIKDVLSKTLDPLKNALVKEEPYGGSADNGTEASG